MPKKYKTQSAAEAQMRKILLEVQLLNLAEKALKDGDSLNLFALMKALEKLISVQWVKAFYFFDWENEQEQRLEERLCDNWRELVQLTVEQDDHMFKLGDSYRTTLLSVMELLEQSEVGLQKINEIVYGEEEIPPTEVINS